MADSDNHLAKRWREGLFKERDKEILEEWNSGNHDTVALGETYGLSERCVRQIILQQLALIGEENRPRPTQEQPKSGISRLELAQKVASLLKEHADCSMEDVAVALEMAGNDFLSESTHRISVMPFPAAKY